MDRRLAAILAADVVGYSRLMGMDESGTLARLMAHRKEFIDPTIATHRGRIVKLMGDGALVEFASVVDALACAIDIQRGMQERNRDEPEEQRIEFRIGINLGDVIVEGDDIYGDGVNVAARLEGLAEPGGICISEAVHTATGNKLPLDYDDIGEQQVKNIAKPVRVYRARLQIGAELPKSAAVSIPTKRPKVRPLIVSAAVVLVVMGMLLTWLNPWAPEIEPAPHDQIALPQQQKPSIAVLPFNNMSGDPAQEYFVDGMTDDLIIDLSRVSGLFVISRNSTFAYKGTAPDVRQVSRDLGVKYVLEGSMRRAGDMVRINAQLIDASTGGHVWAERFDRKLTDVFALQDEVSRKIVSALAVQLTTDEEQQFSQAAQANPEAYDLLLRGLEQFRRFTRETNAAARELFKRAITHDPDFARAYADVALTHGIDIQFGWSEQSEELFAEAFAYAEKALQLDPTLRQGYFVLANLYLASKQHDKAIDVGRKTVTLHPNYADGYAQFAQVLIHAGRPQDGLDTLGKAMTLNPRYAFFYTWIEGHAHMLMRQYDQAISAFKKVIEKNAHFPGAHLTLASLYGNLGDIEEAKWEAAEILSLRPDFSLTEEKTRVPYKRSVDLEYYIAGLRKAGLPD